MVVLTSKDCDIFSDQFGCVFTECEGYQTPAPIVRLGRSALSGDRCVRCVARFAGPRRGVTYDRLLTVDFSQRSPCASFFQLVTHREAPVLLSPHAHFYKKVEVGRESLTAVVWAGASEKSRCTSIYQQSGFSPPSEVVLRGAHSAALFHDEVWYVGGGGNDSLQVHLTSAERCFSNPADPQLTCFLPLDSNNINNGHVNSGMWCDVVATSPRVSALFAECGTACIDARQRVGVLPLLLSHKSCAPICSGGVAGEHYFVFSETDGHVTVIDNRYFSKGHVMRQQLGRQSSVRVGSDSSSVALIVSADEVGVLDVRRQSFLAGHHSFDGDFLDALVTDYTSNGVRICATTTNLMMYEWSMTL